MEVLNIHGQWTGTVVFGKKYVFFRNKDLYFSLDIIQDREIFWGDAIDTGGVGASPDGAIIKGKITDKRINFIKQYSTYHYYLNDEVFIDNSKPGPEIFYTGFFDENKQVFNGKWEIKVKVWLFGFIPLKLGSGSGQWSMKRKRV